MYGINRIYGRLYRRDVDVVVAARVVVLANASSFMGAVIFSAYRKPTASRRHPREGNLALCSRAFARATRLFGLSRVDHRG